MQKTLDKVIVEVLQSSRLPLSIKRITEVITKGKLWFRPSDGKLPHATQVHARINRKQKYFDMVDGTVVLKAEAVSNNDVLLVNITWNPFGWSDNSYVNPKAGHHYARGNVGGESLNFLFNKRNVDTKDIIHGYVQWTKAPVKFEAGGIILFYTRNTDENKGQIVGVYGRAELSRYPIGKKVTFQRAEYLTNIQGEKDFSLLFPIALDVNNYKIKSSDRMVGQNGFTYKDIDFAEKILSDELLQLANSGCNESAYIKISKIYEFYIGKKFKTPFTSSDEKEQLELERVLKRTKSKKDMIEDLKNIGLFDSKEVIISHKAYKRDNKTIAQIKILRDFKCQICDTSILKKDGSKYIEAAHILPKYKRGRETPENIILLCPNHHKEFDYGSLEILHHDKDKVDFILNEQRYKIILSLE